MLPCLARLSTLIAIGLLSGCMPGSIRQVRPLRGQVVDEQGSPVRDAKIEVTPSRVTAINVKEEPFKAFTVRTDSSGYFRSDEQHMIYWWWMEGPPPTSGYHESDGSVRAMSKLGTSQPITFKGETVDWLSFHFIYDDSPLDLGKLVIRTTAPE